MKFFIWDLFFFMFSFHLYNQYKNHTSFWMASYLLKNKTIYSNIYENYAKCM